MLLSSQKKRYNKLSHIIMIGLFFFYLSILSYRNTSDEYEHRADLLYVRQSHDDAE